MTKIAKWAWILLLVIFAYGYYAIIFMGVVVLAFFLVMWLKPEWLEDT